MHWRPAGMVSARMSRARDWQRWMPYAAVTWSLIYAAPGGWWAATGRGSPYSTGTVPEGTGPLVGRLGPVVDWIVVVMSGVPGAILGAAMLRGVRSRALRVFIMACGATLAGVLLMLMTGLDLLVLLGYVPQAVVGLFTGAGIGSRYL